jgi:catechol 2,3-dioxygenase-like lactoylglutathione lyase family enzyme
MGWYIHHVNIPAVDVPSTRAFLRDIAGLGIGEWRYPPNQGELHHDDASIAYFGCENRGIHVVRPIPTFAVDNGFIHKPTVGGHFAITVPDIEAVKRRFDEAGVIYSDAGVYAMAGCHQLYVYDPSMNVIEINQVVDATGGAAPPREDEAHDIHMEPGGWYVHHVNIPSHDVVKSAAFFEELVGIRPNPVEDAKDPFYADPNNTIGFGERNRGIHIVRPTPGFGSDRGLLHNPTVGGHKAFAVPDLDAVKRRMDEAGIVYLDAGENQLAGMRQIYVFDPSNNLIEFVEVA